METNNKEWLNNAPDSKKKSSKAVMFISLAILLLGLAGTGIYFFALDKGEEADNPPSLSFEGGQGFIFSGNYLKFEDKDIEDAEGKTYGTTVPSGIQVLYSNTNTNLQTVVDAIKPDKSLSIMFANFNETTRKFDVFPKGPYGETNLIDGDKLEQYEIPANRGFFLIASKTFAVSSDIKLYTSMPAYLSNQTGAKTYLKNLLNSYPSIRLNDDGAPINDWRLMVGVPELIVEACENRVKSIFRSVSPDVNGTTFAKFPADSNEGYALWVQFQGDSGSCVSVEPGDDDTGDDYTGDDDTGDDDTGDDSDDEGTVKPVDNKVCTENLLSDGKMCIGDQLVPCTTATQNQRNTNEKYICDNGSWKACSPSFLINSDKTYSCLSAGGTWSMVVAEDCEDTDQPEVTISSNSALKRKPLQNELNKFSNLNKDTEYSALTLKLTGIELAGSVSLIQYQNSSSVRLASTDSGTTRSQSNSVASYLNPITSELIALFPNTLADGNYSISIPSANLSFINVSETAKEVCGFTSNVSKVISISHTNTLPASATKCFEITDSQVTVSSDKKLITVVSTISKPANIPYIYYVNTTTPPYSYMTLNNASPEFNSKNYDTNKSDLTFVNNKITSKFVNVSGFNLKESDNEFKLRYLGNMFIIKDAQGNQVFQSELFNYCNPALNVEYIKTVASSTVDEKEVVVGGETGVKDPCKDVLFSLDDPTHSSNDDTLSFVVSYNATGFTYNQSSRDFVFEERNGVMQPSKVTNNTSNGTLTINFDLPQNRASNITYQDAKLILATGIFKSKTCDTWTSPEYTFNLANTISVLASSTHICNNGELSNGDQTLCVDNKWIECNFSNIHQSTDTHVCSLFSKTANVDTFNWFWVDKSKHPVTPFNTKIGFLDDSFSFDYFKGDYVVVLCKNTDIQNNRIKCINNESIKQKNSGFDGFSFLCRESLAGLIDPTGRYACGYDGTEYKIFDGNDIANSINANNVGKYGLLLNYNFNNYSSVYNDNIPYLTSSKWIVCGNYDPEFNLNGIKAGDNVTSLDKSKSHQCTVHASPDYFYFANNR